MTENFKPCSHDKQNLYEKRIDIDKELQSFDSIKSKELEIVKNLTSKDLLQALRDKNNIDQATAEEMAIMAIELLLRNSTRDKNISMDTLNKHRKEEQENYGTIPSKDCPIRVYAKKLLKLLLNNRNEIHKPKIPKDLYNLYLKDKIFADDKLAFLFGSIDSKLDQSFISIISTAEEWISALKKLNMGVINFYKNLVSCPDYCPFVSERVYWKNKKLEIQMWKDFQLSDEYQFLIKNLRKNGKLSLVFSLTSLMNNKKIENVAGAFYRFYSGLESEFLKNYYSQSKAIKCNSIQKEYPSNAQINILDTEELYRILEKILTCCIQPKVIRNQLIFNLKALYSLMLQGLLNIVDLVSENIKKYQKPEYFGLLDQYKKAEHNFKTFYSIIDKIFDSKQDSFTHSLSELENISFNREIVDLCKVLKECFVLLCNAEDKYTSDIIQILVEYSGYLSNTVLSALNSLITDEIDLKYLAINLALKTRLSNSNVNRNNSKKSFCSNFDQIRTIQYILNEKANEFTSLKSESIQEIANHCSKFLIFMGYSYFKLKTSETIDKITDIYLTMITSLLNTDHFTLEYSQSQSTDKVISDSLKYSQIIDIIVQYESLKPFIEYSSRFTLVENQLTILKNLQNHYIKSLEISIPDLIVLKVEQLTDDNQISLLATPSLENPYCSAFQPNTEDLDCSVNHKNELDTNKKDGVSSLQGSFFYVLNQINLYCIFDFISYNKSLLDLCDSLIIVRPKYELIKEIIINLSDIKKDIGFCYNYIPIELLLRELVGLKYKYFTQSMFESLLQEYQLIEEAYKKYTKLKDELVTKTVPQIIEQFLLENANLSIECNGHEKSAFNSVKNEITRYRKEIQHFNRDSCKINTDASLKGVLLNLDATEFSRKFSLSTFEKFEKSIAKYLQELVCHESLYDSIKGRVQDFQKEKTEVFIKNNFERIVESVVNQINSLITSKRIRLKLEASYELPNNALCAPAGKIYINFPTDEDLDIYIAKRLIKMLRITSKFASYSFIRHLFNSITSALSKFSNIFSFCSDGKISTDNQVLKLSSQELDEISSQANIFLAMVAILHETNFGMINLETHINNPLTYASNIFEKLLDNVKDFVCNKIKKFDISYTDNILEDYSNYLSIVKNTKALKGLLECFKKYSEVNDICKLINEKSFSDDSKDIIENADTIAIDKKSTDTKSNFNSSTIIGTAQVNSKDSSDSEMILNNFIKLRNLSKLTAYEIKEMIQILEINFKKGEIDKNLLDFRFKQTLRNEELNSLLKLISELKSECSSLYKKYNDFPCHPSSFNPYFSSFTAEYEALKERISDFNILFSHYKMETIDLHIDCSVLLEEYEFFMNTQTLMKALYNLPIDSFNEIVKIKIHDKKATSECLSNTIGLLSAYNDKPDQFIYNFAYSLRNIKFKTNMLTELLREAEQCLPYIEIISKFNKEVLDHMSIDKRLSFKNIVMDYKVNDLAKMYDEGKIKCKICDELNKTCLSVINCQNISAKLSNHGIINILSNSVFSAGKVKFAELGSNHGKEKLQTYKDHQDFKGDIENNISKIRSICYIENFKECSIFLENLKQDINMISKFNSINYLKSELDHFESRLDAEIEFMNEFECTQTAVIELTNVFKHSCSLDLERMKYVLVAEKYNLVFDAFRSIANTYADIPNDLVNKKENDSIDFYQIHIKTIKKCQNIMKELKAEIKTLNEMMRKSVHQLRDRCSRLYFVSNEDLFRSLSDKYAFIQILRNIFNLTDLKINENYITAFESAGEKIELAFKIPTNASIDNIVNNFEISSKITLIAYFVDILRQKNKILSANEIEWQKFTFKSKEAIDLFRGYFNVIKQILENSFESKKIQLDDLVFNEEYTIGKIRMIDEMAAEFFSYSGIDFIKTFRLSRITEFDQAYHRKVYPYPKFITKSHKEIRNDLNISSTDKVDSSGKDELEKDVPDKNCKSDSIIIINNLTALATNVSNYNFEYYPPSKFIFTSLTYMIFANIYLFREKPGIILYGPSGTGKTESVKYYCKVIGKPLYIFCCNEKCSFESVRNIIEGCHLTKSYICFDEFNRLHKDVMSSLTELILEKRDSIKIFLTMNLGYKGRSELPKTLKLLFGEILVDQPNIKDILYYYTNENDIFKLISELKEECSNESSYDFGLRAISQIVQVNDRKDQDNDNVKEQLACLDYKNASSSDHISTNSTFNSILYNLIFFYMAILKTSDKQIFVRKLRKFFNLRLTDLKLDLSHKNIFRFALDNRNGVIIFGGTGKSQLIREILKDYDIVNNQSICYSINYNTSVNDKNTTESNQGKEIINSSFSTSNQLENACDSESQVVRSSDKKAKCFLYHPSNLLLVHDTIFGSVNKITLEWEDSIFMTNLRECLKAPLTCFFIFDGPIATEWIEDLNCLFDENRIICLPTGERLKIPFEFKFIFETDRIDRITPATLTRTFLIYMEDDVEMKDDYFNGKEPIISNFLNKQLLESIRDIATSQRITEEKTFSNSINHNITPNIENNPASKALKKYDSFSNSIDHKYEANSRPCLNLLEFQTKAAGDLLNTLKKSNMVFFCGSRGIGKKFIINHLFTSVKVLELKNCIMDDLKSMIDRTTQVIYIECFNTVHENGIEIIREVFNKGTINNVIIKNKIVILGIDEELQENESDYSESSKPVSDNSKPDTTNSHQSFLVKNPQFKRLRSIHVVKIRCNNIGKEDFIRLANNYLAYNHKSCNTADNTQVKNDVIEQSQHLKESTVDTSSILQTNNQSISNEELTGIMTNKLRMNIDTSVNLVNNVNYKIIYEFIYFAYKTLGISISSITKFLRIINTKLLENTNTPEDYLFYLSKIIFSNNQKITSFFKSRFSQLNEKICYNHLTNSMEYQHAESYIENYLTYLLVHRSNILFIGPRLSGKNQLIKKTIEELKMNDSIKIHFWYESKNDIISFDEKESNKINIFVLSAQESKDTSQSMEYKESSSDTGLSMEYKEPSSGSIPFKLISDQINSLNKNILENTVALYLNDCVFFLEVDKMIENKKIEDCLDIMVDEPCNLPQDYHGDNLNYCLALGVNRNISSQVKVISKKAESKFESKDKLLVNLSKGISNSIKVDTSLSYTSLIFNANISVLNLFKAVDVYTTFLLVNRFFKETYNNRRRFLQLGYSSIEKFESMSQDLKNSIEKNRIELHEQQVSLNELINELNVDKDQMDKEEKVLKIYRDDLNDHIKQIEIKRFNVSSRIEKAEELLRLAKENISQLSKAKITEIKSMSNPPEIFRETIMCLYNILENNLKRPEWSFLQSYLKRDDLLNKILRFDMGKQEDVLIDESKQQNNENERLMFIQKETKIIDYLNQNLLQRFTAEAVEKTSKTCYSLFIWIQSIVENKRISIELLPLKKEISQLEKLVNEKKSEYEKNEKAIETLKNNIKKIEENIQKNQIEKAKTEEKIVYYRDELSKLSDVIKRLKLERNEWKYIEYQPVIDYITDPNRFYEHLTSNISFKKLISPHSDDLSGTQLDSSYSGIKNSNLFNDSMLSVANASTTKKYHTLASNNIEIISNMSSTNNTTNDITNDTTNDITNNITNDTTKDITNDTTNDRNNITTNDTTNNTTNDKNNNTTNGLTNNTTNDISNYVTNDTTDDKVSKNKIALSNHKIEQCDKNLFYLMFNDGILFSTVYIDRATLEDQTFKEIRNSFIEVSFKDRSIKKSIENAIYFNSKLLITDVDQFDKDVYRLLKHCIEIRRSIFNNFDSTKLNLDLMTNYTNQFNKLSNSSRGSESQDKDLSCFSDNKEAELFAKSSNFVSSASFKDLSDSLQTCMKVIIQGNYKNFYENETYEFTSITKFKIDRTSNIKQLENDLLSLINNPTPKIGAILSKQIEIEKERSELAKEAVLRKHYEFLNTIYTEINKIYNVVYQVTMPFSIFKEIVQFVEKSCTANSQSNKRDEEDNKNYSNSTEHDIDSRTNGSSNLSYVDQDKLSSSLLMFFQHSFKNGLSYNDSLNFNYDKTITSSLQFNCKEILSFKFDYTIITDYSDIIFNLKNLIKFDLEISAGSPENNSNIYQLLKENGSKNILVKNIQFLGPCIKTGTNRFVFILEQNTNHSLLSSTRIVYLDRNKTADEIYKSIKDMINIENFRNRHNANLSDNISVTQDSYDKVIRLHSIAISLNFNFCFRDLEVALNNLDLGYEYVEKTIYFSRLTDKEISLIKSNLN